MFGLGAFGIIVKFILQMKYTMLVKASDNMGTSKNRLTQTMKLKFESCYKLKIGVNNVDIFVDKHVYRHKFCGLFLSTWENIGGQVLILSLLIGSISSILGLIYECGRQQILSTFSVGIIVGGMLIFFDGLVNIPGKKELIRINMKDYLENLYKVRLEHPEMFEQYKEQVENELGEKSLKRVSNAPTRAERAMLKAEAKARLRQQKKFDKVKKKEDALAKKRLVKETRERIHQEEKLAIERKREAERLELEQRKAQAKAEEQRKREEKVRQEEIRKALLLEKKAAKEEKNKSPEHLTIAQARKESLKKEIQNRREHEIFVKIEAENETNHKEEIKNIHKTEVEIQDQTTREAATQSMKVPTSKDNFNSMHDKLAATLEVERNNNSMEAERNHNPMEAVESKTSENMIKRGAINNSGSLVRAPQKAKGLNYLEEKIIADTLKEFLA